jgi:heterodisulfide reductase subunit D
MILIIRDLLEGKLEATEDLVAHMYECLLCEGCNAVCEGMDSIPLGSIEGADIFRALRADFEELGFESPKGLKKYTDGIEEKHNRQGSDKSRFTWAEGLDIPDHGTTILFTGCTAAYADSSSVTSLAKILQKAGVDFGILKDEWCCGALQEDTGLLDNFEASARHNVDAIHKAGAKEVVVTCADCYKALNDYSKYVGELGFEIIHSSELILRLLKEGKIKLDKVDLGGIATYNDPCFLARGDRPVIDAPRELLAAIPGTEWIEMEGFGKYAYCCGRPITAPGSTKTFQKTGKDRIGDAVAVNAKTVVTGCANCKTSLGAAARKLDTGIEVIDIAELVERSMS